MTAAAFPPGTPVLGGPGQLIKRPYRFSDVVRSEWTKFSSVRATYWCFTAAAVLGVGLAALVCAVSAAHYNTDPTVHFGWSPTERSIRPLTVAQLAFAVLGVLTVTAEYSTGMIRTSLAAVPRRARMISAKMLILAVCTVAAGEIIAFAAFLVGQAVIGDQAPTASLDQHEVLRVVIGAGLYLALIAVLAYAIAVILRHAAGGIAVIVAMMFILPGIAEALPTSWSQPVEKYWPTNAGSQVYLLHRGSHTLGAWSGLLEMALFTLVVIAVAYWQLEKRDA